MGQKAALSSPRPWVTQPPVSGEILEFYLLPCLLMGHRDSCPGTCCSALLTLTQGPVELSSAVQPPWRTAGNAESEEVGCLVWI